MVEAAPVDGDARVADGGDLLADRGEAVGDLDRLDVGARRHHARDRRLAEHHRALEQRRRDGIDLALALVILDRVKELLFRLVLAQVRARETAHHLVDEADRREQRPDHDHREVDERKARGDDRVGRVARDRGTEHAGEEPDQRDRHERGADEAGHGDARRLAEALEEDEDEREGDDAADGAEERHRVRRLHHAVEQPAASAKDAARLELLLEAGAARLDERKVERREVARGADGRDDRKDKVRVHGRRSSGSAGGIAYTIPIPAAARMRSSSAWMRAASASLSSRKPHACSVPWTA